MRRFMLAAATLATVLGVSAFTGTAQAHWHDGWRPAAVRYYYRPPVVYPAPVVVAPPVYGPPVVYPTNSISFFGRNFALRFGF